MRSSLPAVGFITFLLCVANSGCSVSLFKGIPGSGTVTTETREVDAFTAINSSGSGKMTVTHADEISVQVTCDDNLLEHIKTSVEDGTLVIRTENNLRPTKGITYTIACPKLTHIKHSGSGSTELVNLTGDSLTIRNSGSGSTKLVNHQGESLDIELSGSGGVKGDGSVNSLTAKISGSGGMQLSELKAATADASVSGSGGISVHASEKFSGSISGSGGIKVHGSPEVKIKKSSGSGRIEIVN